MTTIDSSAKAYTSIDDLSVELADGVLSVTLNRPNSLNSLTAATLMGIADALEHANGDPRVKVVRLGGAGRGFSSGAVSAKRTTPTPARAARLPTCSTRPTAR
jgi:enoyl-CoA hydratase